MTKTARLARTVALCFVGSSALFVGTQPSTAEAPSDGVPMELSQEERELIDSGEPANVLYDSETGQILSVTSAGN